MYQLNEIRAVHLEVTSKCQASCPMCVRNIQGGIDNPWLNIDEITLDRFKKWLPIDFINQLDRLYMCGNTGDPIMSKDILKIFEYIREINPTINLSMNTNGSARSKEFWTGLAKTNVNIRFGIDGLGDTHSLYRIGTDWDKIINNCKLFITEGGDATWDMLIFEHNKHQVDECRKLSEQLGFKQFVAKNTSRFRANQLNVIGRDGKTSHILYPSDKSITLTKKLEDIGPCTINCKVTQDKSLYIAANGLVSPCCWLDYNGMNPASQSIVDFKDRDLVHPDLNNNTLIEIFDSEFFDKIEQSWDNNPLRQCSRQCGKVDKFNEQF
jgi:MoaA/NifB/PqqE/SkfB family radical SAM enzyme